MHLVFLQNNSLDKRIKDNCFFLESFMLAEVGTPWQRINPKNVNIFKILLCGVLCHQNKMPVFCGHL
jgi:hypothetical protein